MLFKRRPLAAVVVFCATILLALPTPLIATGVAQAQPGKPHLDHIERAGQRVQVLHVYSAAMDRIIPLLVITPFDTTEPRPTLYLLNGAGGGEDAANWRSQTDIVGFFADKNVNVVIPMQGAFSYYTDWQRDDPVLGRNMWSTFLTRELPPIVDATLGATGVNAIAGVSMSATAALNLAIEAPDLYRAVGAYSGCASTADPVSRTYIELVLARAGADVENMWGDYDDPAWRAHDAILNAEQLRGKTLYISNSSGLPGPAESPAAPGMADVATRANQIVLGGIIEAATNVCTHRLVRRLQELSIPAHVEFRSTGTHTWKYWEEDLHKSWPIFAEALRGDGE